MENLEDKQRIDVKVSSNLLAQVDEEGFVQPNLDNMRLIGDQIVNLRELGHLVVLYTSGAAVFGMHKLGVKDKDRPDAETKEGRLELQRYSIQGQVPLFSNWEASMPGCNIGQLLLTRNEWHLNSGGIWEPKVVLEERRKALDLAAFSVNEGDQLAINENDGIADDEIGISDNGKLAAMGGVLMNKDGRFGNESVLVLLGTEDGIYEYEDGEEGVIPEITMEQCEDPEFIKQIDNGKAEGFGTGKLDGKFEAGYIATSNGIDMFAANGTQENAILRAIGGQIGTRFIAQR
jgi:glutamate 5-kinase